MSFGRFDFVKWLEFTALTLYTIFCSFLLVYFEANILVTMAVLSVLPAVVLWRLEHLQTRLVPIVLLLSLGVTLLFEASAYVNGIWYELSPSELRLFDLVPVEAFVAAFVHILYFVVVYEYFFDDGRTSAVPRPRALGLLLGGASVLGAFGLAYLYIFSNAIVSYSFGWLLFFGGGVVAAAMLLVRRQWFSLLGKTALFATMLYPISLVYEYVALSNNLRFFANMNEYIYYFDVLDQPLPLEELLFIWLVPFWVATIYELYIDDGE